MLRIYRTAVTEQADEKGRYELTVESYEGQRRHLCYYNNEVQTLEVALILKHVKAHSFEEGYDALKSRLEKLRTVN